MRTLLNTTVLVLVQSVITFVSLVWNYKFEYAFDWCL